MEAICVKSRHKEHVKEREFMNRADAVKPCPPSGGGMGTRTGLYAIPVLTPNREEKRQNGRRMKTNGEPSFTLTGQDLHGVYDGSNIRRLTPTECCRLQGFPDDWVDGISDSQKYRCLGNAVTVNVVMEIAKRLKKVVVVFIFLILFTQPSFAGIDFSITNVTNPDYNFLVASHFKTKKEARKFASQYRGNPHIIKRIEDRIKVLEAIGDPSGQLKYFRIALQNLRIKGANMRIRSEVVK